MAAVVKIYTREFCGYCSAATRFLKDKGVKFEEIDCTGDSATRQWLASKSGQSTVPQIFIDDKSIGGYTDLRALDARGELDRMLAGSAAHGSSSSG
jgi:glutaredoxin 3